MTGFLLKLLKALPLFRKSRYTDKEYINDKDLLSKVPIFAMLNRKQNDLKDLAEKLSAEFNKFDIKTEIIKSKAQCGGGTLPQLKIDSLAVKIVHDNNRKYAEKIHQKLLELEKPILGILREGDLLFDVLTISEKNISYIAQAVDLVISKKK